MDTHLRASHGNTPREGRYISRFSRQMWVIMLLNVLNGYDNGFHYKPGTHKRVFQKLAAEALRVAKDAVLCDTWHVPTQEQVAIFQYFAHRGLSNRALQERFQRSIDTVTILVLHSLPGPISSVR